MKDKEFREQKARIVKLIKKWSGAGFYWWRITYEYDRSEAGDEHTHGRYGSPAAKVETNWEYRSALITFFLPCVEDLDDEELEHTLVHEYAHLLIASIQDYSDDNTRQMTEYAAETVARALIWTHKHVK